MLRNEIESVQTELIAQRFPREYEVRQGIVLRLLAAAGWPVFDVSVVYPEYWVGGRSNSVDFALCHPDQEEKIFIEAKSVGSIANAYQQLRKYVYTSDAEDVIPLGVATDGRIWDFFFFSDKDVKNAPERPFQRIDLLEENFARTAETFTRFLGYREVGDGQALKAARNAGDRVVVDAKSVRNAPPHVPSRQARVTGALSFTFGGETVTRGTNEEVMAAVVERFIREEKNFFERFMREQRDSNGNPYIAPTREELWPGRPDHQRSRSIPLQGGGFIKRLTRHTMARMVIQKACETAGVRYGVELTVYLSNDG